MDQRADLYALGATLHQTATGAPPFGRGDLLALIHDHLARVPVLPAERNPRIESLDDRIALHSLPGTGTTLELALPLEPPR